jgi:hypothetical protein
MDLTTRLLKTRHLLFSPLSPSPRSNLVLRPSANAPEFLHSVTPSFHANSTHPSPPQFCDVSRFLELPLGRGISIVGRVEVRKPALSLGERVARDRRFYQPARAG